MKIQNLVLLGGVVLIILAIVILSLSYYQGVENTEIIKIETENLLRREISYLSKQRRQIIILHYYNFLI